MGNIQRENKTAATIKDVAKLAMVSTSTVSRYINNQGDVSEESAERIKAAIQELNYRPSVIARALKFKATKSIGLIIPSIENPVFPPLVKVIEDTASRYGFSTILCNSEGDTDKEAKYLELLLEKQVDGIIFDAMGEYNQGFEPIKKADTPIVVIGKKVKNFETANVTASNYKGAFSAVEYLIKTGMKKIVFLSGKMESSSAISDRFEGYRAALQSYNIPYDEKLVVKETRSFEGGIYAADELLSKGLSFDAIFASNDIMAIGCMERLSESGYSIPKNISIIGYDDIPSSRIIRPRLSTVLNPQQDLGVESVKMVLRRIHTGKNIIEEEKSFDPVLKIRESTLPL